MSATMPTVAELARAKENLAAFDDVINGDSSTEVETPGGQLVKSIARAIATLQAYNDRGTWANSTLYAVKDVVRDPDNLDHFYVRVTSGTSPAGPATFADEYDGGDGPWRLYYLWALGVGESEIADARRALGLPGTLGADFTQAMRLASAADGWTFVPPAFAAPINFRLDPEIDGGDLILHFKTAAGNDPSDDDPIFIPFRDPTLTSGAVNWRKITSALSLTMPSGGTGGVGNNEPLRYWFGALDNTSAVLPYLINCCHSNFDIYPLREEVLESSTAIGTGSDSTGVLYAASAVSNKPHRILGYIEFPAGLAVAGVYDVQPRVFYLSPGMSLPGQVIQPRENYKHTHQTITTPRPTETDNKLSSSNAVSLSTDVVLTPRSSCNVLRSRGTINFSVSSATSVVGAIFRDSETTARSVSESDSSGTNGMNQVYVRDKHRAGTTSPVTMKLYAGAVNNTLTINGSGGNGLWDDTMFSGLEVEELQA